MHRTVVVDTVFNFLSIFNVSNVLLISDDSGACLSTTLACKGMHLTRIAKSRNVAKMSSGIDNFR